MVSWMHLKNICLQFGNHEKSRMWLSYGVGMSNRHVLVNTFIVVGQRQELNEVRDI